MRRGSILITRPQYRVRILRVYCATLCVRLTHTKTSLSQPPQTPPRAPLQALKPPNVSGAHTFQLRPYQEECVQACTTALASGEQRIGVSLPTGSGKTTVFLHLLSRIEPPAPGATRSLVIVNSIELARQTRDHAARLFPHWKVGLEQGGNTAAGDADMYVRS